MNNMLKEISKWSLFLFITLVLSCVGVEKKSLSDQRLNPSEGITDTGEALQYAYQNYAFACLAILNENYRDAVWRIATRPPARHTRTARSSMR